MYKGIYGAAERALCVKLLRKSIEYSTTLSGLAFTETLTLIQKNNTSYYQQRLISLPTVSTIAELTKQKRLQLYQRRQLFLYVSP